MQILIEPAAWRYQNRRVGFEQLDDGIGCIFVRFSPRNNVLASLM